MIEFIIKYWIEVALGLVLSAISFALKKSIKKQKAIEQGVQALLRNELIKKYREYEAKGEITILDKENTEHLFNEYKNLGGNGTVAKMYEDIMEMKIKIIGG